MYTTRPLSAIPTEHDAFQVLLAGQDIVQKRMRCVVYTPFDFVGIELTDDPSNCLVALGWTREEDFAQLQRFSEYIGKHAPHKGIAWAAREIADGIINWAHNRYPNEVGKASYFAAFDANGNVELPDDLSAEMFPSATLSHTTHALNGAGRFYVGGITTPPPGGSQMTGIDDGGAGSQIGSLQRIYFSNAQAISVFGTGSITNPENTNEWERRNVRHARYWDWPKRRRPRLHPVFADSLKYYCDERSYTSCQNRRHCRSGDWASRALLFHRQWEHMDADISYKPVHTSSHYRQYLSRRTDQFRARASESRSCNERIERTTRDGILRSMAHNRITYGNQTNCCGGSYGSCLGFDSGDVYRNRFVRREWWKSSITHAHCLAWEWCGAYSR